MAAHMLFAASKVRPPFFPKNKSLFRNNQLDYRLMHQSAFSAIELWSAIRHPGIVPIQEAFTTKAFNDNCTPSPSSSLSLPEPITP
jgi:hypothetical protein